jgi:hypothetical protein
MKITDLTMSQLDFDTIKFCAGIIVILISIALIKYILK